jgi:phosphoserine phosphatase RsbU/P
MSVWSREDLTCSILIVDDTPNNLRLLSQMLAEHGYRVRAVMSGVRALEAVKMAPPDMILLDIRMPHMDGFEVCRQLKADDSLRHIPVIFISALDDIQEKVNAFSLGGLDYITKPFQLEEVLARVGTHLSLQRLQKQLQDANARFHYELELAGRIQTGILPRHLPDLPGWQFDARLLPARETSGDFYDIGLLPDGKVMIAIADVTDKGAGAAMYMALCCTLLRSYAARYPDQPEEMLAEVNQRLLHDVECEEFVTAFYAVLDPKNGRMVYCNAGHIPPFFISGADQKVQKLIRTGMPLGILEDSQWEMAVLQLSPGDCVVLYTDGVTDAENSQGEFFLEDRFLEVVQQHRNKTAKVLLESVLYTVNEFVGSAPRFDDIALVIVMRQ